MGDQHPLDPFAQFEGIVDALRDAAQRLHNLGNAEMADVSHRASEAIEALKAALQKALVTLPDGRTLLTTEHKALMEFASANGISKETLWGSVEIGRRRRVRTGYFHEYRVTDISALACCAKIVTLDLHNNRIEDISALASCRVLAGLSLEKNRITDISALASCGKLRHLYLGHNQITDISALERCRRLFNVSLACNPLSEKSAQVIEKLRARGVWVYC